MIFFRVVALLAFVFSSAYAENRPSDDAMFGASPPPAAKDAFQTGEVKENALSVGGIYYQRLLTSLRDSTNISNDPLSVPLQFDAFMDARPTDRLRGFVNGRLLYDPTGGNSFQSSQIVPTASAGAATPTATTTQVALDQAWLKFDLDHTVFVTVGKQHVKWGTSRFWNPTDFLHTQLRDPFTTTDLRTGNSMVKFVLPVEKISTNFYAIALFDNPAGAPNLGEVGGAFRAETVLGKGEIGVEMVARSSRTPVYGADLSTALGPFDVYAEGACVVSPPAAYQLRGPLTSGQDLSTAVTTVPRADPAFQVSGGINYSFGWKDNRLATVGVEYFHNDLGYTDPAIYPALVFLGAFQPFYLGKDYAGIYLTAEGPDSGKYTNYTLSTLANLSDSSFYSRLDFSWRILTYLTFEASAGVHYGVANGEFSFGFSSPALTYQGNAIPAISVARSVADFGLGLRVSF